MNKNTHILFFLFFMLTSLFSQAQYKYLRYTDLEKWKSLSHAEKIETCQIPKQELEKMPTSQVLELCLSYPLLSDIFWDDRPLLIFNAIKTRATIFIEFYQRPDAGIAIINVYKENKPEQIVQIDNKNNVPYIFLFIFLDVISSEENLIRSMATEQRKEHLSLLAENVSQRTTYSTYYSSSRFKFTALTMGRIFQAEKIAITNDVAVAQRINNFIATGYYSDWSDINLILTEAAKYKK